MHPRFLYDLEHCSIRRALDVLGEKWTLLIVREAVYGITRFDDFARALKCGRGVLSLRLRALVEAGVLEQREYAEPGRRPRSEYLLTAQGREIFPAVLALAQWAERWFPPPDGPVALVRHRQSGRAVKIHMTDDTDAKSLSMDDIRVTVGPGAKRISSQ